jgi:AcrR family transcriptional regulator
MDRIMTQSGGSMGQSVAEKAPARTRRKSERRREQILRRATECFDRKGYANTSLDDIAKAVGIKREGIYYYFKNRAQILLEVIEPQSIGLVEGISAIVDDRSLAPREKFRAAIRNHLERFDRYCLEMTVSMRDGRFEGEPAVRDAMVRIWKGYESKWAQLIEDGQAAGAFRQIGDPKMLAFGILGMCNWLARWYDPRKPVTVDALIDSYTELLSGGLFDAQNSS